MCKTNDVKGDIEPFEEDFVFDKEIGTHKTNVLMCFHINSMLFFLYKMDRFEYKRGKDDQKRRHQQIYYTRKSIEIKITLAEYNVSAA